MSKRYFFLLISLIGALVIFSSTMSKSPILPLFAKSLMTSESELQYIGYVLSASTIPGILISIFAGRLSDIYGRERLIFISVIIFATAPFLYILATNIWILVLIRFYHGFSTAIFVPVATAAIAETYPERKGERISLFSSITLIGRFLAPLTGGAILYITKYYYYGVYLACGFSGVLALIFSVILLKSKQKHEQKIETKKESISALQEFLQGLKTVISNKAILAASYVQASQYFAYGIIEAYIVLYADQLNYPAWLIGIIPASLVIILAIFKPMMGYYSDKFGRRPIIIGGLILGGLFALLLPYFASPFILILLICGFGFGMAMVTSSTAAFVADVTDKGKYGVAIGTLSTIMDIGQALGPIVSGYLLVTYSYWGIFTMVGLVLLSATLIFGLSIKNN